MKISRIEHLGIAVQSIDEVLPYFENVLGLKCYKTEVVEDQKVKTAFLQVGEVKLELLEPTSPESTIQKWIDKGNKGPNERYCLSPRLRLKRTMYIIEITSIMYEQIRCIFELKKSYVCWCAVTLPCVEIYGIALTFPSPSVKTFMISSLGSVSE